jgi:hypothetical protein
MEKTDLSKESELKEIKEEDTPIALIEREKTKEEPEKKKIDKGMMRRHIIIHETHN